MNFYQLVISLSLTVICWRGTEGQGLRNVELSRWYCARRDNISESVKFTPAQTVIKCAKLYLESYSGALMLVAMETKGTVLCGFSSDIPVSSSCGDTDSDVNVYGSVSMKACLDGCTSSYTILGSIYCLQSTGLSLNYTSSIDYCNSIGGQLPEGDTHEDILQLVAAQPNDRFYLGGDDFSELGVYRWRRGELLNPSIWADGEPSRVDENCLAIQKKSERYGVIDMVCDRLLSTLCSIPCD